MLPVGVATADAYKAGLAAGTASVEPGLPKLSLFIKEPVVAAPIANGKLLQINPPPQVMLTDAVILAVTNTILPILVYVPDDPNVPVTVKPEP